VEVSRIAQLLPKASLSGSVLKLVLTCILYRSAECMQIPPACGAARLQLAVSAALFVLKRQTFNFCSIQTHILSTKSDHIRCIESVTLVIESMVIILS
jgi:hypothetical protein